MEIDFYEDLEMMMEMAFVPGGAIYHVHANRFKLDKERYRSLIGISIGLESAKLFALYIGWEFANYYAVRGY